MAPNLHSAARTVPGTSSIDDPRSKILIVDDSRDDSYFAQRGLEQQGYRVLTHLVETPEDLVTLRTRLKQKSYDLAFLDTKLGGKIYGPNEVADTFRASGNPVPIIGWTATPAPEHEINWMRAGAKEYHVKPEGVDRKGYETLAVRVDSIIGN